MRRMDELHLEEPTFGSRGLRRLLKKRHGFRVGLARVTRLMRVMGLKAIYPKPRTSRPGKGHKIYPYLLRGLNVTRPNQVWCADITYIPMPRGYCYVEAVMDWYSRMVLGWQVSTTMDTDCCLRAFRMVVTRACCVPEIMNTDHGSQFTSLAWTEEMQSHDGLRISMDGKGRWLDNVFIERLWWSMKWEDVYLRSYQTPRAVAQGLETWFIKFNDRRRHFSLADRTPLEAYIGIEGGAVAA